MPVSEILPCPFCGSNAAVDGDHYHGFNAQCDECGTRVTDCAFSDEAKAAEAWNRRAPLMPVPGWQKPETAPEGALVWIAQLSPTPGQVLYDSARVKNGKFKIGKDSQIGVIGWAPVVPFPPLPTPPEGGQ